jgi:hypothetical protein
MTCSAALVFGRSSMLTAQVIQLRPVADVSLPTRVSFKNGALDVRQRIGLTLGARMTVSFSDRFQMITGVNYVPGYAVLRGTRGGLELNTGTHSLSGSTGARYFLLPPWRNPSWDIHTGVGMIFGGSPAYADLLEPATLTGALGTTVAYAIGRIVRLQMTVQQRLYRIHFGSPVAGSSKSPLQLSFKVGFPFLKTWR